MQALRGRQNIAPTHSWPTALYGVSGQRHASAALYPRGKDPPVPIRCVGLRADMDTEARRKSFASTGDRIPVVKFAVRHYTDWAAPAPCNTLWTVQYPSNRKQ
jgi:hypothetical protein